MKAEELYKDNLRDTHWLGKVVDTADHLIEGRCRVMVYGKFDKIPTESIPWATSSNSNMIGSYSTPKLGDIVYVNFDNGDIYHPEYTYTINSKDRNTFKTEILEALGAEESVKAQSIVYDVDNKFRIYYEPNEGLIVSMGDGIKTEPFINVKQTGEIHIHTDQEGKVEVFTDGDVEVKGKKVHVNSPAVELGELALEQVIKGNTFQALFNTHTHTGNLGLPTTPPMVPLTGTELSKITKTE